MNVATLYSEYVQSHGLERLGLLAAARGLFTHEPRVLYPGSFIHVTASCFFQNVVYVDKNPLAIRFFAELPAVERVVAQRQTDERPRHMEFINADYTNPLPFDDASFDLVLSLFAPDIARTCSRYLASGGLLLTNNHARDAMDAAEQPELTLIAVGHERGEACTFTAEDLGDYLKPKQPSRPPRSRSERELWQNQLAREADYYLFRKT